MERTHRTGRGADKAARDGRPQQHFVSWVPSGLRLAVPHGEVLLEAARAAGLELCAPCDGVGTCGKCRVRITRGVVPPVCEDEAILLSQDDLARGVRLACRVRCLGDLTVAVEGARARESEVLGSGVSLPADGLGRRSRTAGLGLAVDIGTTTIAVGLFDLASGEEIAAASAVNPQTAFGHDVLTRVRHARRPGGLAELSAAVRQAVDGAAGEALTDVGAGRDQLRDVVVAGNTAMTHLLLGLDVQGLGRAPYVATSLVPAAMPAAALGLKAARDARVTCLPSVSAFVGGDIVAGLLATALHETPGTSLLVDLGTNGEIVLARDGELLACSCAAGPAFEGMGISCGTRAAAGAVDGAYVVDGRIDVTTIGGDEPDGICGSGVIDVAAALLEAGVVGASGRFTRNAGAAPWAACLRETPRRFVLSETPVEVSFSQQDVRQVQLAKGAMASGISALLTTAGLDEEDVNRLLIAGQFGHHVRPSSLGRIGLIPATLEDRVEVVGNTSKSGAALCLLSEDHRRRARSVASGVRHLELSTLPRFERLLAAHMTFPAPEAALAAAAPHGKERGS